MLTCTRLLILSLCKFSLSYFTAAFATAALGRAQVQAVLARLPPNVRRASISDTLEQVRALKSRQAEQLRQAGYPVRRSLEALRLEDPATMSGCWNPGCAAALAQAGVRHS